MTFYNYPEKMNFIEFYPHLRNMNSVQGNTNLSLLKAAIIEDKVAPYQFKLSYPVVKSLPDDQVEAKINKVIIAEIAKLFKNQALSMEDSEFADIASSYEISLNEKGLLSILFHFYTYTYHAAHGYTYFDSLTFDLKTGKTIDFSELFNPKLSYLQVLNEIAIKKVKDSDIPLIADYEGIREDQKFYLTPDSIVLYYQVYEYTPYSFGRFEIKISYKEIENMLYPLILTPVKKLL